MEERFEFEKSELSEASVPQQPMDLLKEWIELARDQGVTEYQAMVLSTLGSGDRVSSRVVYSRAITESGIIFYTNYQSRKGNEAEEKDQVAANFFWKELERQIRVEGTLERISSADSDLYFSRRPRGSQIGAWASEQSKVIPGRAYLEGRVEQYEKEFEGRVVTRPDHWGGYLLKPDYLEFWQGRKSRLHDRIIYEKSEDSWDIKRLAP